ncbi:MAG TPA: hypothetical protein VGK30_11425 [Candidatus Binatia bacterium]|jgi:hypothetical protein
MRAASRGSGWLLLTVAALGVLGLASPAGAHGVVGQRFFPATLTIDDPFVADELSLPTVQSVRRKKGAESPPTWETEVEAELSKRLSRDFGISLGGTLVIEDPNSGPTIAGFDNMAVSAKYVFLQDAAHELLLSGGLEAEVGGTGQKRVDADSFSTISPQVFFGKGFGDLPDSARFLKPLALTGAFGLGFPTSEHTTTHSVEDGEISVERELNPRVLGWGFSLQYNLQYLQSYVEDVGLAAPFNRMIPIVEFAMETSVQGVSHTAGTINPGVLWFGRYVQLGLEAVVPINGNALGEARQAQVGVIGQIHFYLDDILPEVFTWTPFSGVLGPTQPR